MTHPIARATYTGLLISSLVTSGCASSLYGWDARTNSTPFAPGYDLATVQQFPIGLFPAVTTAGLRGNEAAISHFFAEILVKAAPHWKVVPPHEIMAGINKHKLAQVYFQMRTDYDGSNFFDVVHLRQIAEAVGARYVFQPRLVAFSQTMTDRWKFPPFSVLMSQTRSSNMRLMIQLWDVQTGAVVWGSLVKTEMQSETISQDPVYLEDVTRATMGSVVADLLSGRQSSKYTSVNKFVDDLITEAMPKDTPDDTHPGTKNNK